MKTLSKILLLIVLPVLVCLLGANAQVKPSTPKDTTITYKMESFTKAQFDASFKRKQYADSVWQRDLIIFLEAKLGSLTPELQLIGYDKGQLTIKTKK